MNRTYRVAWNGTPGVLQLASASTRVDPSASWKGAAGFASLGDSTTTFTGIFGGLGHTISGLAGGCPGSDYVGLFGHSGVAMRQT